MQTGSVDLVLNLKGQQEAVQGISKLKDTVSDSSKNMTSALSSTSESAKAAQHSLEHMADAGSSLGSLREHIEIINGHMKTFTNLAHLAGAAVLEIAGAEFIKRQAEQFAEFGEQIERASAKTGLSTQAIQEWNYAAKVTGTSLDVLLPGFRNLTKNAVEAAQGHGELAQVFKSLNLELRDSNNHIKSTSEISGEFITALAGVSDKALQVEIAQKAMGRGATEFLPLIEQGAEGLNHLKREAQDLGAVLDENTIKKAAEMKEAMSSLGVVLEAAKFRVVLPVLESMTDALTVATGAVVLLEKSWAPFTEEVEKSGHGLTLLQSAFMAVADLVAIVNHGIQGLVLDFKILESMALVTKGVFSKFLGDPAVINQAVQQFQDAIDQSYVSTMKMEQGLTALRSNLEHPLKRPKAPEGGGEGSEDLELRKQEQSELLALQKETAKALLEASTEGFDLQTALENEKHKEALAKFKDSNVLLQEEARRHNAEMALIDHKQLEEQDKNDVDASTKAEKLAMKSQKIKEKQLADEKTMIEDETKKKTRLDEEYTRKSEELDHRVLQSKIGLANDLADAFGVMTGHSKAALLAHKVIAATSIVFDNLMAQAAALAPPPIGVGPVLGLGLVSKLQAEMAFQLAGVAAQAIQGFTDGGIVRGPYSTGDRMNVRVNAKEMILNESQQANLFAMINQGGSGQGSGTNIHFNGNTVIQMPRGSTREDGRRFGEGVAEGQYSKMRDLARTDRDRAWYGVKA